MHNEFRPILISIILFGLFAYGLLMTGIYLAHNNSGQSIIDDPTIANYTTDLQSNLIGIEDQSSSSSEAFSNSSITLTSGFAYIDAIGGLWKAMYSLPKTVVMLTFDMLIRTFGGDVLAIVLGALGAIIVITIIFAVWKLVSQGESG